MSEAPLETVKNIFADTLEVPPGERERFLEQACEGNGELLTSVRKLLAGHERVDQVFGFEPNPTLAPGTIVCGKYRILRLLGSGGMSEVYEVFDEEAGGFAALKMLGPEQSTAENLARFRREMQLARKITHRNVCRVYDYHRQETSTSASDFLSMELISGETLASRLKEGPLPMEEATAIALQVCDGLGEAHRQGIIHRDLKPGNIMLALESDSSLRVVLTDFGLSRATQQHANDPSFRTGTEQIAGTPAYISPEQLRGEPADARSDIYSLGLVLYEMVTGSLPFQSETAWGAGFKRLTDAPEPPVQRDAKVPAYLNALILRCLELDPAKRFESVAALRAELAEGPRRRKWRQIRIWVMAAAVLAIVSAAAVWGFRQLSESRLPAEKRVAVLPFSGAAGDGLNAAFDEGIAQSVAAGLGNLRTGEKTFWTVPYADVSRQSITTAARARGAFGVSLAIEGSLRREGEKAICDLRLIDAKTGRILRSGSVSVARNNLGSLADEVFAKTIRLLELRNPANTRLDSAGYHQPGAYEFYQQGNGYLQRFGVDNLDRAAALFEKALAVDPHYNAALTGLAQTYASRFYQTKDQRILPLAESACARALEADPGNPMVHVSRGMLDLAQAHVDEAVAQFEKARELDSNRGETLNWLGRAYDARKDPLQAEAMYQAAINLQPDYWAGYNNLGEFYFRHAQYRKAEPLFKSATELAPDTSLPFSNLGGLYLAVGRFKDAEAALQRAVELRPSAGPYTNLGTALMFEKQYRPAAEMFRKATAALPKDLRHWRNLGDALSMAGDAQGAHQAYTRCSALAQEALSGNQTDVVALSIGAICEVKTGDPARARQQIAAAIREAPQDGAVEFRAAIVWVALNSREDAMRSLEAAVAAGYSWPEIANAPDLAPLRQDFRFQKWMANPPAR